MNAAWQATLPLPPVVTSSIAGVAVAENVPVAPLTTLRVGPVARRLLTCTSTEQVIAAVAATGPEALILAGGSNVVLADDLPDLTVVRLANTGIAVDGAVLRAESGAVWDDVVAMSLRHGLGGLECLSGIPGSTGATPVQNVGAYGAEVADTIRRVRLLDRRTGEDRWAAPAELGFGYRTSILKNTADLVVLEVEFALDAVGRSAPIRYGELATALGVTAGERADPAAVRAAVLAVRLRNPALAAVSAAGLALMIWSPISLLPEHQETAASLWRQLAGSSYLWWALAVIVVAGTVRGRSAGETGPGAHVTDAQPASAVQA